MRRVYTVYIDELWIERLRSLAYKQKKKINQLIEEALENTYGDANE